MTGWRRTTELVRNLHAILGAPGLMIGAFSILSFAFGLFVLASEYDRPRKTGEQAVHRVLEAWVRSPDYLGLTLVDQADLWRRASDEERPVRLRMLREALAHLGSDLDQLDERFPLISVVSMDLTSVKSASLARWVSPNPGGVVGSEVFEPITLTPEAEGPSVVLRLTYRSAAAIDDGVRRIETSYRRLLLALIGLSGFSLLCFSYMILHARALSERVAREAAQEATLDLADRTCHELGNGVFVLTNERRNLADHLDLVERFISQEPSARDAAARRAGVEPEAAARWNHALKREYAARGIDPDLELRGSAALARHVCRQIDVCSEYISMTVRELDGFLKRSALPVERAPVDVIDCFEEAVALLRPRLESSDAVVIRRFGAGPRRSVLADRRLLIHALVNLIKNAVEAAETTGTTPEVQLSTRFDGRTAWLGVTDNGPGISRADLRRVFDVGFSTKGTGRGRGLSIVRESVHIQEGRIVVECLPGSGTRFEIGLEFEPHSRADGHAPDHSEGGSPRAPGVSATPGR